MIDQMFNFAANPPAQGVNLHEGHAAHIAAIVALIGEIPPELIVLDLPDYIQLILSLAVMRNALDMWKARVPGTVLNVVPGHQLNPITLVRRALVKCPDEAASPETTNLAFIGDQALRDSIRLDISAANRDLINGEWKGATVLAGSAVEALLLWAIGAREAATPGGVAAAVGARRTTGVLTRQPDANIERWDLHEYVEVAEELGVIGGATATQARQAKDFRNLIHPGRAARLGQKCDRATALAALAAVEFVVRDLTP